VYFFGQVFASELEYDGMVEMETRQTFVDKDVQNIVTLLRPCKVLVLVPAGTHEGLF
jgi:hypothetical protein